MITRLMQIFRRTQRDPEERSLTLKDNEGWQDLLGISTRAGVAVTRENSPRRACCANCMTDHFIYSIVATDILTENSQVLRSPKAALWTPPVSLNKAERWWSSRINLKTPSGFSLNVDVTGANSKLLCQTMVKGRPLATARCHRTWSRNSRRGGAFSRPYIN